MAALIAIIPGVMTNRSPFSWSSLSLVAFIVAVAVGNASVAAADPIRGPSPLPTRLQPRMTLAMADKDDEPPPIVREDPDDDQRRQKIRQENQRQKDLSETPAYKRWWFWVAVGAIVVTGVVVGATLAKPDAKRPDACTKDVLACFGDGRN